MSAVSVPIYLIVLPSIAVLSLLLMVAFRSRERPRLRKRAKQLGELMREGPAAAAAARARMAGSRRREQRTGLADRLLNRILPNQTSLRTRLLRTGKAITPGSYILACVAVSLAAGAAVMVFAGQPLMVAVPAGLAAGLGLPHLAIGYLTKRRANRFVNNMPDAIDTIVRGVRSGLPVTESMAIVAREMGDPVGTEFRRTVDTYRLGRTLPDAMAETARRLDIAEFDFLVVAMSIQQETGGNLGETLANLGDIIRKRKQMRLKIKALTGESRASAWIVGSLPFILYVIINLLNPGYTDILLEDPRGQYLLGGGLTSMAIGLIIMHRLSHFEI